MFLEEEQTDLTGDTFIMLNLTESQNALVEKFNMAFYEAQNETRHQQEQQLLTEQKDYQQEQQEREDYKQEQGKYERSTNLMLPNSFDDCYFKSVTNEDTFLLDYLISKDTDVPSSNREEIACSSSTITQSSDNVSTSTFDYKEFAENFEQVLDIDKKPDQQRLTIEDTINYYDPTSSDEYANNTEILNNSPFFVPLPFTANNLQTNSNSEENFNANFNASYVEEENLDCFDFSDTDFCDNLSNSSIDFDNIMFNDCDDSSSYYLMDDVQKLPPVNTIVRNNVDFMSFIRSTPQDTLMLDPQNEVSSYLTLIYFLCNTGGSSSNQPICS